MDISQIVPLFPPSIGGLETSVYNLVKELDNLGHNVSVITADIPPTGSYKMNNINVRRLPVLFQFYKAPICPTLFQALNETEKSDIIHVHTPPRTFSDIVLAFHRLKRNLKTPCILSVHLYLERAPILFKSLSDFHYMTLSKFIFNGADRILVPTISYKALFIKQFGILPEKIIVVPNGVDVKRFDPKRFGKRASRKKYGISSRKVVLFIGRLDPQGIEQKGIMYYLKAASIVTQKFKDVKFVIAGGGGNEQTDYIKHLAEKLGISNHIKFIIRFPTEETPLIHSMADIFVLPSLFESFGISLIEAMAMERPVISTKIRGVKDVVKEDETGFLVPPMNANALAKEILHLLNDEKLAVKLGRNGRKHVEDRFDWKKIAKKVVHIYETVRE